MGFLRHLLVIAAAAAAVACTSLPIDKHKSSAQNKRIQSLVLHFTAGNYKNSMVALKHSGQVSSHYLIPSLRDESYPFEQLKIVQLVEEHDRAWHAGYSHWQGRDNLNDTSIGIEIVHRPICQKVYDNQLGGEFGANQLCHFPEFEQAQIDLLVKLVKDILARHPDIEDTRIIGHSDIAPMRKSDPGPSFPWRQLAEAGIGAWYEDATFDLYQHMFSVHSPSLALTQRALRRYGYKINVTGQLDNQTQDVLLAFQSHFNAKDYGGGVTVDTNAALFALLEKYASESVESLLTKYFNEADFMYAQPKQPSGTDSEEALTFNTEAFYGLGGQGKLVFSKELIEKGHIAINGIPLTLSNSHQLDMFNQQLNIGPWVKDGRNVISTEVPNSSQSSLYHIEAPRLRESDNEWMKRHFSPLQQLAKNSDLVVGYKGEVVINQDSALSGLGQSRSSGDLANHLATQITTLQLVEEGVLQLNSPVSDYLPDYTGQGREFRTLSHLLTHTSGYPREFNLKDVRNNLAEFEVQNGAATLRPNVSTETLLRSHLPFAYGLNARQEYSGINDQLLALIAEAQTETPLAEHIQTRLLEPMDLTNVRITESTNHEFDDSDSVGIQIDASAIDLARLGQLALNQGRYGGHKWWSYGKQPVSTNVLSPCDLYASEKVLFVLDHQYGFVLVDETHHLVMANLHHQPQNTKVNECGLAPSQAELINMTYQMLYQLQSDMNKS